MFDDYQEPSDQTDVADTLPSMADLVELEADLDEIDNTLAELQD